MDLNHLNILLADDDTDDCNFFKEALIGLSISANLTAVHDGEQLMQHLNNEINELPHVLFLDINMPRKNGLECLSEIKKHKKLKDLPVVILSTSSSKDKIGLAFKSGSNIYITKPGDFSQLKQLILHALPIAVENIFSKGSLKYILNA
jgi:CheY-like chemotaxis protein